MLKKMLAALSAAILLFSLCACTGREESGTTEISSENSETQVTLQAGEKFLDSVAANTFKNKKKLVTFEKEDYFSADYRDKHIFFCAANGGRVKIIFEYDSAVKLSYLTETFGRSGGRFLYFTKQAGGDETASLNAYYLPTMTEISVVGSPCSNFLLLDVPESYEMHTYGFVATATKINVINLCDGSISARYSKTTDELASYIEMPDAFFGGGNSTVLEQADRAHLRVKVMNGDSVKDSFLFNCALGVATEEEK